MASPARAAPGCAATGALGLASVTVTSPAPGQVPARFKVSGRASATLPLSQVELLAGGSVVASRTFAPDMELPFEFEVGPEQVGFGPKSLRVVACGGGALAGTSLVRGESAAVAVQVQAPATTTSSRPPTSTTSAPSTTTTVARSTTTTKAKLAVAAPGPLAGELAGGLTDGGADGRAALSPPTGSEEARQLLLSGDGDPGEVPPRQAWVGLVVVGSGAVALGVSVLLGRGRAAVRGP
ncbi:MAG: hypothetical protein ACRD0Q_10925 [Acidimicrobiales bacterium]